jgi:predicted CXXCH cytochrome family protein
MANVARLGRGGKSLLSRAGLRPNSTPRLAFSLGLILLFGHIGVGCSRPPPPAKTAAAAKPATKPLPSANCRACHEEIFKAWSPSDHAHAHRPVDATADADAFVPARDLSAHGVDYHLGWKNGKPEISEKRGNAPPQSYPADFVLGYRPLRQYIVPLGGGRYQAAELAFDPAKKEWFNVFADERRQPGEWGHWRGRGMNWNSMCAHCHFTDFNKNYDVARDTYSSTWLEHGVGCMQCHAEIPATCSKGGAGSPSRPDLKSAPHAKARPGRLGEPAPPSEIAKLKRAQETCAPCHARNELLTGKLQPGGAFHDYQRLTLPVEANVFYPDGQVRDEDFNYTSLLTSRMGGKAGVTCMDCHDPHSTRTLLPATDNALCMRCHATPGPNNAPVIDPLAHSHHKAGSVGNQCISCHMPTTTYMQRAPRHDHGFLKPDPLLTKELGIPNACSRCHADQTIDWSIKHADEWYGAKMNSRQRERARIVAAAQHWNGNPTAPPSDHADDAAVAQKLLALVASEDVPAWKATLLLLTRHYLATEPRVIATARTALADTDPLVRSAAVQVLASVPSEAATIRPLLSDPTRLVRLDAAWALSAELAENSPIRRELDAYLAVSADQPAGRLRIAQDLFNRGRAAEAEAPLRKAAEWDPNSAGIHDTLGFVLSEVGKPAEAAASLWRAAQLSPTDATPAFNAALAFAQAGKLPDAELALRETLRRNPRHDRAHYNLGLLLNQTGRVPDAIVALENAERLAPRVADYPYARATILMQRGDRDGALTATRRALQIDPANAAARELLTRLSR